MELEKEIELLKKKLELLELIKKCSEEIAKIQPVKEYIPYPIYPNPWPYNPPYIITSGETTRDNLITKWIYS